MTFCHTNHFQGEDQRGWNQCRIFVRQMFGSVYLQSEKTNVWWGAWDSFSIMGLQSWVCCVECVDSHLSNLILVFWFLPHCWFCNRCRTLLSTLSLKRRQNNDKSFSREHEEVYLCGTINDNILTLLVSSQKTLGTVTKLKCFSSSAHRSEFLASFSKSSSWANVPFKSCKKSKGIGCSAKHTCPHTFTVS